MSNPASTSSTSAPMIRDNRMFPTRSLTASGQSTQLSCTSRAVRPKRAATAATCRVWLDCTPPIETSVSQPVASASATRYSSLRVLFPPYARPLLQSSRLAHRRAPPRCLVSRSSGWIGDGPKSNGWRGKRSSFTGANLPSGRGHGARGLERLADELGQLALALILLDDFDTDPLRFVVLRRTVPGNAIRVRIESLQGAPHASPAGPPPLVDARRPVP